MSAHAGVYRIRNTANEQCYVGSAVNIAQRFDHHRAALCLGTSGNPRLMRAWKEFGPDAFAFEVVENVPDTDKLAAREQYWIDRLRSHTNGYNKNSKVSRPPLGKRSDPDFKQKAVLLRTSSVEEATGNLKRNYNGRDFSELLQVLLDQWNESEKTS